MSDEDALSILDNTYYDESRVPPPESGEGKVEEESWDWGEVLVDHAAYMIDERNHTTARCRVVRRGSDGVKADLLQVTFCLAPPPHIAYFCISYNSGEPTRFLHEPKILATEGNIALIGLRNCTLLNNDNEANRYIYFVYRAPTRAHDSLELRLLTQPSDELFPEINECYLPGCEVGILRYRSKSGSTQTSFTPPTPTLTHNPAPALARRHKSPFTSNTDIDDCDAYKIALYSYSRSRIMQYDLCTYDSMADAWTRKPTAFLHPQDAPPEHSCDRVITIGCQMGWVDLWRGILLCDVHVPSGQEESSGPILLRYIPLPEPMQPDNALPLVGFASFFRDIAVVEGRIKFVDIQIHAMPGSRIPNGWTVVTWTMEAGDLEFRKEAELHSRDLFNGADLEPSLFVGHPTLSSHDRDVLYLMAKASIDDPASLVIAVNMKTKMMERVTKFTTQRAACMDIAYMRSTISNYFAPDPKGNSKRRRPVLQGSSRKKQPVIKDLPPMGEKADTMDLE